MYDYYCLYVIVDEDKKLIRRVSRGSRLSLEKSIEKMSNYSDKQWLLVSIFDVPQLKKEYTEDSQDTVATIHIKL